MLKEFPPNFSTEQMLNDKNFIEIIKFGILTTWRAKMVDQNFVPTSHTLTKVIESCEKEEITETMLTGGTARINLNQPQLANKGISQKSSTNTKEQRAFQSGNKSANAKIVSYANSNGTDGCMIHINAVDHTTHECHILKKQVEKMK